MKKTVDCSKKMKHLMNKNLWLLEGAERIVHKWPSGISMNEPSLTCVTTRSRYYTTSSHFSTDEI